MHYVADQDHIICFFMGAPWGTIPVIALSEMLQSSISLMPALCKLFYQTSIKQLLGSWSMIFLDEGRSSIIQQCSVKYFFYVRSYSNIMLDNFLVGSKCAMCHVLWSNPHPKFNLPWQQWGALHQHCKSKKEPPSFPIVPLRLYPSYTANAAIKNEGVAFSFCSIAAKQRITSSQLPSSQMASHKVFLSCKLTADFIFFD